MELSYHHSYFIYLFTCPISTPIGNHFDGLNVDLLRLFIYVLAKSVLLICMHAT